MDKDSATGYVHQLLHATLDKGASDLFITAHAAPSVKADGQMKPLSEQKLNPEQAGFIVRSIMNDKQLKEFEEFMECNFAISLPGKGRFRVNTFHHGCLVTQREVGVDTDSYEIAMKNTLRQAPDVILLGEIRDRETMEYAIAYAETGHLCLSTLHANSTNQAIDRIINFFPEERRDQLLMDLSLNLKGVVSQRLLRKVKDDGRLPAVEVMLNTPMMADLIYKGDIPAIKELIAKSNDLGMCTFDQAIFRLIDAGMISVKEGLRNADSVNDLRLQLKLNSRHSQKSDFFKGTEELAIETFDDYSPKM